MDEASFFSQTQAVGPVTPGEDPYELALDLLREKLRSEKLSDDELLYGGEKTAERVREVARGVYQQFNDDALHHNRPVIPFPKEESVRRFVADILGMGSLQPLLDDPGIEDIAINGPSEVMVYRSTGWETTDVTFRDSTYLQEWINGKISHTQRQASEATPIVDAVLRSGARVSIVTKPVVRPWPVVVIRVQRARGISLANFVTRSTRSRKPPDLSALIPDYAQMVNDDPGMLSPAAATYLNAAVLAGLNITMLGPTGCGKTTMINALGSLLPENERVLVIEDTPEIDFRRDGKPIRNTIYLCTRPKILGGAEAVTQADLIKLALRQRPSMLSLGEARGQEAFDLLVALHTGHKNGLTSIHANSVDELFNRMYLMLGSSETGRYLDRERAAHLVAGALHIVIALEKRQERRFVREIGEFTGKLAGSKESPYPELSILFEDSPEGLRGPLRPSVHRDRFLDAGINPIVFENFMKG